MKRPPAKIADARLREVYPQSGFNERQVWVERYLNSGEELELWIAHHKRQIADERFYNLAVRHALGRTRIHGDGTIYAFSKGRFNYWGVLHSERCDALVAPVLELMRRDVEIRTDSFGVGDARPA